MRISQNFSGDADTAAGPGLTQGSKRWVGGRARSETQPGGDQLGWVGGWEALLTSPKRINRLALFSVLQGLG